MSVAGYGCATDREGSPQEAVVVPETKDQSPPKVGDFCNKNNIRARIEAKKGYFQTCINQFSERKAHQGAPPEEGYQGKLVVSWLITLEGETSNVVVATREGAMDDVLEYCFVRGIKQLQFERPKGGICIINYPFIMGVKE